MRCNGHNTVTLHMVQRPRHPLRCNNHDHNTPHGAKTVTQHCTLHKDGNGNTPHGATTTTTTPYVAQQLQPQHPMWCNNHNHDTPRGATSDCNTHMAQ